MNICEEIKLLVDHNLTEILACRNKRSLKSDGSYVTTGDVMVQDLIYQFIQHSCPSYHLVSEEQDNSNFAFEQGANYIVVDPIDGTENFTSGLKEWGIGVAVYSDGVHQQSMIYLPELGEVMLTGMQLTEFESRIHGLSSSLKLDDLKKIQPGFEYRIMGCSMYNLFNVIRGSYAIFENVKGVNTWDILPGVNLALEHNCSVLVNGDTYHGEFLPPNQRYRIKVQHR